MSREEQLERENEMLRLEVAYLKKLKAVHQEIMCRVGQSENAMEIKCCR